MMKAFPAVILTPLKPLTMTLYLSYPMTTIDNKDIVPKKAQRSLDEGIPYLNQ